MLTNTVISITNRRYAEAENDRMLNSNIKSLYGDFKKSVDDWRDAVSAHDEAQADDTFNARFDKETTRRCVNAAEGRLICLATRVSNAILRSRKTYGCVHRIRYSVA